MAEAAHQSLGGGRSSSSSSAMREYRKGNWTFEETMVLIEAKKMDDERRQMKRQQQSSSGGSIQQQQQQQQPTELRWKWVEDYCWSKGCYRSQNQCNDKWDNLMRDYKKLRDFHRRSTSVGDVDEEDKLKISSYWKMERSERKEKKLPTNMSPQIYEALLEVVDRNNLLLLVSTPPPPTPTYFNLPMLPPSSSAAFAASAPVALPVPLPPLTHHPSPPSASDPSSSQAKRRRTTSLEAVQQETHPHPHPHDQEQMQGHNEEGEFGRGTSHQSPPMAPSSSLHEMGSAISRGASAIVGAIRESEEREERRHREMVNLQERRLMIENSVLEMSSAMVEAVNRLANSILSLASSHSGNNTG